jgi:DNA-directed RNA polymerase subunit RPC12/RpoP
MSKCDGCGKPIGHASTIEGVYEGDELEKDHYYFGDSECKRIFEEKKGVEEKIECHDCGKVVLREEAKAPTRTVSGIRVAPETCKDCAEEVTADE